MNINICLCNWSLSMSHFLCVVKDTIILNLTYTGDISYSLIFYNSFHVKDIFTENDLQMKKYTTQGHS